MFQLKATKPHYIIILNQGNNTGNNIENKIAENCRKI